MPRISIFLLTLLFCFSAQAQNAVIYQADTNWVNQKMDSMTMEEKIGQLFMVAAYSNKGKAHEQKILKLIKEEQIGGLIFFQGSPEQQAWLTNAYQQQAKTPLMIAMDAEWGLAMRLPNTFKFPWPITLGAIQDTVLAYEYGKAIGEHCRALGIHINFAPVVDINTNPKNPIIGARSFGEDPEKVSEIAAAVMRGMQSVNVLAVAKHFPGHGDTDADSHKTLPTVSASMDRLEEVELYPYRQLSKSGLGGVIVAHLNVPAIDPSGKPTSLSKPAFDLLRNDIGFDGLTFTDALNMQGVARDYAPGLVDLESIKAGNDVLVLSQDVKLAKSKIIEALKDGSIDTADIEASVARILAAKYWFGLQQKEHIESTLLDSRLNRESDQILNRNIYAEASTLLINKNKTVPLKDLANAKIACVGAGTEVSPHFGKMLKKYSQVEYFEYSEEQEESIIAALADYDYVILGVYTSNANPWKSYKVSSSVRRFTRRIGLQNKLIISVFANPYSLINYPEAQSAEALLMAYQNNVDAESVAAQIIFGALGAKGRLPVSAGEPFEVGFGLNTEAIGRLGYHYPGAVGLDRETLQGIDRIVEEAINQGATPGAQVLVARKGQVIYNKNFGYIDSKKKTEVLSEHIYDLASITKISVTVPLLMSLVERGKINLDKTLGHYLPEAKGTNKEKLVLREILAHQSGLKPWIPFYTETLDQGKYKPGYYGKQRDFNHPNVVSEGLYSQRYMRDTILKRILDSDLRTSKDYKYSDLGYYLFMQIIERIEGKPLNELIDERLFGPLGANTMVYRPLETYPQELIVPTEDDKLFRRSLIRGYVHDQGAALLGGVAGHAGLFSTANDLAKLMQMYMQKGEYAGVRYFDSVTVNEFIRCQYCQTKNRRGIGFDKPQLEGPGPTCGCVSDKSFGHSGFTGTLAWADPEEQIIYIFLSNRVHPDAGNKKLLSLSTRTNIQEVIYNAIKNDDPTTELIGMAP
ncbi:MAG: serine hydrolase [Bacteroidetes bacterium]|nr:serine hydrolase [Bacteroidota bacterium]